MKKIIKPAIYTSRFHRTAVYRLPYGGNVIVSQSIDIATLRWGKSGINWSAIGCVNPNTAQHFAAVIQNACDLALRWDKELARKKYVVEQETE